MSEISGIIFNLLKFLNLNLLMVSMLVLQAFCFIAEIYIIISSSKKRFEIHINKFIYILSLISVLSFLISFFIADKIYQPAAVFIMLIISESIFVFAVICIKRKYFKRSNGESIFNIIDSEKQNYNGITDSFSESDIKFEDFLANLREKIENADAEILPEIALYISNERDKGEYLPRQKKILNEELCKILKSITVK